MDSTTAVILVAAVLAAALLAVTVAVLVRLVRTRRALRRAGLPTGPRWVFWGALAYFVLPADLGGVLKVPHSTHGARHAPSPHRPKTQVRPVRGPSSGTPRARTEHRGHRTGLSKHPLVPDPVYLDDIGVLLLALRALRGSVDRRGPGTLSGPSGVGRRGDAA